MSKYTSETEDSERLLGYNFCLCLWGASKASRQLWQGRNFKRREVNGGRGLLKLLFVMDCFSTLQILEVCRFNVTFVKAQDPNIMEGASSEISLGQRQSSRGGGKRCVD